MRFWVRNVEDLTQKQFRLILTFSSNTQKQFCQFNDEELNFKTSRDHTMRQHEHPSGHMTPPWNGDGGSRAAPRPNR